MAFARGAAPGVPDLADNLPGADQESGAHGHCFEVAVAVETVVLRIEDDDRIAAAIGGRRHGYGGLPIPIGEHHNPACHGPYRRAFRDENVEGTLVGGAAAPAAGLAGLWKRHWSDEFVRQIAHLRAEASPQ